MLYKNNFKEINWTKSESCYVRYLMGAYIKACILTFPPSMEYQLNNSLTKKLMSKDLLRRRIIIQNDIYQEDADISKNKICRRSGGSREYVPFVVSNFLCEWIWSPLIYMSSSYFSPIITNSLAYIKMNSFPYII